MKRKYELKNFPSIFSLHDCETSSLDFLEDKLIFYFDKKGLTDMLKTIDDVPLSYNKLKVSYLLNCKFEDTNIYPVVKHLNQNTFLRKNAIQYLTLKKLVNYLNNSKISLRFDDHYFNYSNCIIFLEVIKNGELQLGNFFQIELLIDEIIYEWIN